MAYKGKMFAKEKYIDFKANGRLFPTWVMANFKKFKLPEIIIRDDIDACATSNSKFELRKYQVFASKLLDYRSPYQDILLYHGLGSGKTLSAINIYNMLYNYTPGWNVFIIIKATLRDHPWMSDLEKLLKENPEKDFIMKNITFISYDSPTADKQFLEAVKNADTTKKNLYMFDETHNFIANVYSNISSKKGRRAQNIYDYIIQDKLENEGVRVILLSGTPAINKPFEMALLFNLLRPGSFPKSESQFEQLYVTDSAFPTINPLTKNMFQRRILGLISYYVGSTIDMYAKKTVHYIDVPMSKYQEEIYNYFEEIETLMAMKKKAQKSSSESYKTYTRQASNFVFPALSQNVTGENRPRPNKFKISEKEANALETADKDKLKFEKGSDLVLNINKYKKALEEYVNTFDDYLADKNSADIKVGHTIKTDIDTFLKKYKGDYEAFFNEEKKKSQLFEAMYTSSPKMIYCIFIIISSPGPTLIYTNYVLMEGIQMLKIYMKHMGFSSLIKTGENSYEGDDYFRYAEYHGMIEKSERKTAINNYNVKENIDGKVCKVMMISPAGAEGLSLRNCRQVHILEPYWHEVRIVQMIGRALRACYHVDLPMKERTVDVYRFKAVRQIKEKDTTDQYIENVARSKEGLIESFYSTLKEVAIDCNLFKAHNMMEGEYKCFQFDEPSLFDEYIGPAYKQDLQDDMKNSNGSNSVNSQTIRIRAKKIKAVKQLTKGDEKEEPLYSKPASYWFNPETGVVYDFELYYAIGKVGFDNTGVPKKLDKNTYIIDRVIPIPLIDEEVMN